MLKRCEPLDCAELSRLAQEDCDEEALLDQDDCAEEDRLDQSDCEVDRCEEVWLWKEERSDCAWLCAVDLFCEVSPEV